MGSTKFIELGGVYTKAFLPAYGMCFQWKFFENTSGWHFSTLSASVRLGAQS